MEDEKTLYQRAVIKLILEDIKNDSWEDIRKIIEKRKMENSNCIKCGDLGSNITLVLDDGEFSNTLGVVLCNDCYNSILECITEMLYD